MGVLTIAKCTLPDAAKINQKCEGRDCSLCGWNKAVIIQRNEMIQNKEWTVKDELKRIVVKVEPRPMRKLPSEENGLRLALYNQGLTDAEIGEMVGTDRNTITAWRYARGLKANKKRKGAT